MRAADVAQEVAAPISLTVCIRAFDASLNGVKCASAADKQTEGVWAFAEIFTESGTRGCLKLTHGQTRSCPSGQRAAFQD